MAQPSKNAVAPFNQRASSNALLGARLCFAATLVMIPVRYHFTLAARPVPQIASGYTDFQLYAADLAVLFTLVLWAISLMFSYRAPKLGPRYIWISLAGVTLAAGLSTLASYDRSLSLYQTARLVVLFCFYLFVVNEIHLADWIMIPLGLQLASQSLVALGQFITQRSIGLQAIGEAQLDPAQNGVSVVVSGGVRLLRAYGLSDHPNILGGCLAFGSLVLLAAYLHASKPWLALTALLLAGPALLVTFSRSAWIAFLVGCGVFFLIEVINRRAAAIRRMLWVGLAWAALCLPVVLVYRGYFGARLNAGNSFSTPSVEQQSVGERLLLVNAFVPILAHHPLFGVGVGAAPLALKAYRPDWPVAFEPPHFAWLDAALETGVAGGAFYLALIIAPFAAYWMRRKALRSDVPAGVSLAVLLAIAIAGLFDYYTWMLLPGRLWQWLAWGLWAVVSTPGVLSMPQLVDRRPHEAQPQLTKAAA